MSSSSSSSKYEAVVIPLLARRSCHLPGNSWREDWWQYMRNNHILFGICFHHPLHPVEWWERILAWVGSVSFGLAATTTAYLWDRNDPEQFDQRVFGVLDEKYVVTTGMIALWTLGCLCHSILEICMWNIMACACLHPGGRYSGWQMANRCKDCGSYLMIPVVLGLMTWAAMLVVVRASNGNDDDNEDQQGNNGGNNDDDLAYTDIEEHWSNVEGAKSFSFLTDYTVELALAWFVYFPLTGTILFSGILGCNGRLPFLGGRPRDKRLFEEGKLGGINNEASVYARI